MLVTSSRAPMMGPLVSPSSTSPSSHHLNHHHHLNHLDDEHHPADLSPRSSNSSLISSNESLLNTSISVPSPTRVSSANQRGQRRTSGGSSGVEDVSESVQLRTTTNASNSEELNALQNLRNAFERSPFSSFFQQDHHNQSSDNEQMEQHISKTFAILGSPVVSSHHHLLSSPTNMGGRSGDDSDDETHHAMAMIGHGSPKGVQTIVNGIASVIFQCPLCAVVCNSRHDFNEHLVTHSTEHRACPSCSFVASNEDVLREHVHEAHGTDDIDMLSDDEEVKTPKTNAQGKLKTFKCKQCDYTAVTKKEFWDHNKTHIRHEKMLHCPKCAFVTEYKHHLEYHLRNHMGSKPYQCTKCNYSCVNKSMLNSHLKSHSNVYQYRCADCSYATKYCHSLKLHLRKYNHNPAMVLNPDGTPNPLPIIDVYGTRRGPKIKRPDPILEGLATTQPMIPGSPKVHKKKSPPQKKDKTGKAQQKLQQQHILDTRDLSPKPASSPRYISSMPNQSATPPLKKMKEDQSSGDSDSEMRMSGVHHHHHLGKATQLPQAPISPSSIAMILQRSNGGNSELAQRKEVNYSQPPTSPNPLELYNAALNQYLLNPMFHLPNATSLNEFLAAQQLEQKTKLLAQLLQSGMVPTTQQQNVANDLRTTTAPTTFGSVGMALDLSGRMTTPINAADDGKKRKRKGKAHRYERRGSSEDEDDLVRNSRIEDEALDFSNNNNNSEYKDKNRKRIVVGKQEVPTDLSLSSPPLYQNMMCKYCEISFPDRELYNIHMNYHSGDIEPFLCKSCGKKTRDKVDFFRHLTTDPH